MGKRTESAISPGQSNLKQTNKDKKSTSFRLLPSFRLPPIAILVGLCICCFLALFVKSERTHIRPRIESEEWFVWVHEGHASFAVAEFD